MFEYAKLTKRAPYLIKELNNNDIFFKAAFALSKAATTSQLRGINLESPESWEFSGFSQNGEDGIIDFLTRRIINPNKYFVEIGSADGFENNTAWLAVARKFSGLMIEGNQDSCLTAKKIMNRFNPAVAILNSFVEQDNIEELLNTHCLLKNPDVFSIDIDGNDYYISKQVLSGGFRPKIFVVEYNSVFGPHQAISMKYKKNFSYPHMFNSYLYYGCSISAYKNLFNTFNYQFVTVDSNGVNAFFVDKESFNKDFLQNIKGNQFVENVYLRNLYKGKTWEFLYKMIEKFEFDACVLG